MPRITPSNRGETAVAWGLGIVGGLYGLVDEFSVQLGGELASKGREITKEATHKWLAAHEVGVSTVALVSPLERLTNVIPLHVGVEAVSTEAIIIPSREEMPLQAA